MNLSRVVVVGASAAGLTAAETLRREGYEGRLTLVDADPSPTYDRPPLSKQLLRGEWERERLALRAPEVLDSLGAYWHLGSRATRLDLDSRNVDLADGSRLPFDGLVVATGVHPRRIAAAHGLRGVHVLRTVEDALDLRRALVPDARAVVVGAGFLGSEAAAVARELGCAVTLVEPGPAPLARLGARISARVARLHVERGVDLRCGTGVSGFRDEGGHVTAVLLDTGEEIPASVVLVAIGSDPVVDWLGGSGLTIDDGLVCDEHCLAAPGVAAAGDVASWQHPALGRLRLEHRMNATEQGMAAARALLGSRVPFAPVPYFWSDQFDVRIQVYGVPGRGDFRVVDGDPVAGPFTAVEHDESGRVRAVAGWNMPRQLRALRQKLVDQYAVPAESGGAHAFL